MTEALAFIHRIKLNPNCTATRRQRIAEDAAVEMMHARAPRA